ncbi:hypothetical protein DFH06DRAFT_1305317 [Mycena polygramma]|nr:hypothetical protein DFH06DRAFT_1305317 [Mycena polygramma]
MTGKPLRPCVVYPGLGHTADEQICLMATFDREPPDLWPEMYRDFAYPVSPNPGMAPRAGRQRDVPLKSCPERCFPEEQWIVPIPIEPKKALKPKKKRQDEPDPPGPKLDDCGRVVHFCGAEVDRLAEAVNKKRKAWERKVRSTKGCAEFQEIMAHIKRRKNREKDPDRESIRSCDISTWQSRRSYNYYAQSMKSASTASTRQTFHSDQRPSKQVISSYLDPGRAPNPLGTPSRAPEPVPVPRPGSDWPRLSTTTPASANKSTDIETPAGVAKSTVSSGPQKTAKNLVLETITEADEPLITNLAGLKINLSFASLRRASPSPRSVKSLRVPSVRAIPPAQPLTTLYSRRRQNWTDGVSDWLIAGRDESPIQPVIMLSLYFNSCDRLRANLIEQLHGSSPNYSSILAKPQTKAINVNDSELKQTKPGLPEDNDISQPSKT